MPNHITNVITVEDAAELPLSDITSKFLNDQRQVDFSVIVPAPKCLAGFEPHFGILSSAKAALGLFPKMEDGDGGLGAITKRLELSNAIRDISTKTREEDIPSVIQAIENYAECGYLYWYDWNRDHWGTKWNAYGQPEDGHPKDAESFKFETAWAHPNEIVKKISKSLPGVVFHIQYADEDTGSNCGAYRIKSGETFDELIAPRFDDQTIEQKRKFTEFAFRLRYGEDADREEYGYDENWQYSEDVEENYHANHA